MTRIAVITIAHGRHDHLAVQQSALARSELLPDDYVVVAMDDPELADWHPATGPVPRVVQTPGHPLGLQLAAARNAGAAAAMAAGATLMVFLDVDCMPATGMLDAYRRASEKSENSLLCGPVSYLPPAPEGGYDLETVAALATPHPARPAPPAGTIVHGGDPNLFWSLSFALTETTWRRIGGFCELYVGYGAEDTDFARIAELRGSDVAWVGGASAFHQYHPTTTPPVQHVDDILRNGALFNARWGRWPMEGWLDAFMRQGLVERSGGGYRRTPEVDRPMP